jgi:RNA polymerase sigma-70 factor, ECF subfamily
LDVTPELVRAAQSGDSAALEDLIARSYRPAYTLALRLMGNSDDAEEATQEAFIRIVRGLKRFREVGAFPTWMFKIVSNVCMTELKRRQRRDVPTDEQSLDEPSGEDAEEAAIGRIFWERIEHSVRGLPETYRSVVVLRDVYGLSGEDTAKMLGISTGAVKVRLHRARRRLRDELADQFPEWQRGEGSSPPGGAERPGGNEGEQETR